MRSPLHSNMITIQKLPAATTLLPFACAIFLNITAQAQHPNIIVVMTDDQGYPELSAHGNPVLNTPNLDKLHSQSIRFTDFHVSPMCTPTRGSLMTGLDPARHGAINVSSGRTLLRAELPTMAKLFADQGYHTGLFGKWHLGDNYPYRPNDRGFQEALWFPSSHIGSTPDAWGNNYFDDQYRHNNQLQSFKGYCTDIFFDHAMAWMKKCAASKKPFFTYLPTNTPHSPFYAPKKDVDDMEKAISEAADKLPKLDAGTKAKLIRYLAMIRNIDHNMGRLITFLDESDLAKNTILVFLTDNGSTFGHAYYPAGMRGKKTQLWEGGHRVPCFIRWPKGKLGKPRDIGGLTQVQDLLPTLLELSGAGEVTTKRPFDGISLAPVMRGKSKVPDDRLLVINYSRMPGKLNYPTPDSPSIMRREGAAVLWKRWRLLQDRELYDLEKDPLQKKNVIDSYPEITKKMRTHLNRWWKDVAGIANEAQRIIIGHQKENPSMLTACEWLDVFIDQQEQIQRGERKNSYWTLEVAQTGEYEFELRRWPRDADLPLNSPLNSTGALPINQASLFINDMWYSKVVHSEDKAATFKVKLQAGPIRLHTWFNETPNSPISGAYYVYVNRLTPKSVPKAPATNTPQRPVDRDILRQKAIHAMDARTSLDLLTRSLAATDNTTTQDSLMRGMLDGLEGRRQVPSPKGWSAVSAKLEKSSNSEVVRMSQLLSQIFGDKAATAKSLAILRNSKAPLDDRRAALKSLVTQQDEETRRELKNLINDPKIRPDAIRAYSALEDEQAPAILLKRYKEFDFASKRAILETLATRNKYSLALLRAVGSKTVAREDVPAYIARALQKQHSKAYKTAFGGFASLSTDKEKVIAKYEKLLTPRALAAANAAQGRVIYQRTCTPCHTLYGEGGKIGPELTGSNRANLDYILLNMIDPSGDIPDAYKLVSITTKDGQLLAGTIAAEDDQRIVLNMVGLSSTVLKKDIKKREISPLSMMPEGLIQTMKNDEVINLVKYLQSTQQVNLPK